nr:hypothetical protein [Endozoicomonas sp.]
MNMYCQLSTSARAYEKPASSSDNDGISGTVSVTSGGHTVSPAQSSNKLSVTATQLHSLTGNYVDKSEKTIPCNILQYGQKLPEQITPPGKFHGALNDSDKLVENLLKRASVAKTVFNPEAGSPGKTVKAGHESEEFKRTWDLYQQKNLEANRGIADPKKQQFNGKQLCVYFSIPQFTDDNSEETGLKLKLVPSDYFSQAISRSNKANHDISTVRTAYNCGAIMLVMTTDNKVVFGYRNDKPMFTAGFIFGDREQQTDESIAPALDKIGKTTTFADLARETALNERREEVYDDDGNWDTTIETFGMIGEALHWPSKKAEQDFQKSVFVIKSTVFMEHIPVSSKKLEALRQKKAPKDDHELGELHYLGKDDFKNESRGKEFIAEHAKCFEMLSQFFTDKVTEKN